MTLPYKLPADLSATTATMPTMLLEVFPGHPEVCLREIRNFSAEDHALLASWLGVPITDTTQLFDLVRSLRLPRLKIAYFVSRNTEETDNAVSAA